MQVVLYTFLFFLFLVFLFLFIFAIYHQFGKHMIYYKYIFAAVLGFTSLNFLILFFNIRFFVRIINDNFF